MSDRDALLARIGTFLDRHAEGTGQWENVSDGDLHEARDILSDILDHRFPCNSHDGNVVSLQLANTRKTRMETIMVPFYGAIGRSVDADQAFQNFDELVRAGRYASSVVESIQRNIEFLAQDMRVRFGKRDDRGREHAAIVEMIESNQLPAARKAIDAMLDKYAPLKTYQEPLDRIVPEDIWGLLDMLGQATPKIEYQPVFDELEKLVDSLEDQVGVPVQTSSGNSTTVYSLNSREVIRAFKAAKLQYGNTPFRSLAVRMNHMGEEDRVMKRKMGRP